MSSEQLRYVAARTTVRTNKEAVARIGVNEATIYRWENKADVDEAVQLMLIDGVMVAYEILRRSTAAAAAEIEDELAHKSVHIRHLAAIDILDRQLGKPKQEVELKAKVEVAWNWETPVKTNI